MTPEADEENSIRLSVGGKHHVLSIQCAEDHIIQTKSSQHVHEDGRKSPSRISQGQSNYQINAILQMIQ